MPDTLSTDAQITDRRFAALKAKLRELFELDKSDLDFGIYRIMAAKNEEVTAFLDRQLRDVVRETLTAHGADAADEVRAELDKVIANLRDADMTDDEIDQNKKVVELRTRLDGAGGASIAELGADIYNHLLNFFSRYYDEGDFISKRRYKGDTYAIPYSGEEVVLHWANKDQYYIKSGEWHKDYRFRAGGKSVRFQLVDATEVSGNNKEPDEAKRRYILVDDQPVVVDGNTLALRFHFRAPTDSDKERAAGAVAIFGGDYAKPRGAKKGDERTQFCADAEQRALEHVPAEWQPVVTAASATDDKPARTILGKHLDHFTARNAFDYFIHKDLGGFLSRELDFYIKNEVARLDDLETLDADHLARWQGRIKAIRRVAGRIIDFLAALENFQKKLWLKKKLVLNTNWLVTVDRIPASLRDQVVANQAQWAEWQRLGFKPADDADDLFDNADWGTRAYLDACDKLVVDTAFFDSAFKAALLVSEEVLGGADTLEDATTGVLVNGDNFHGIKLTKLSYLNSIKQIYIDPPYNAKFSQVAYKNTFLHSSWMSLMATRMRAAIPLARPDCVITIAIDENEQERLGHISESLFPAHERSCISIIHNHGGIQGANFSYCHEYAYFIFPSGGQYIGTTVRDEADIVPFRDWGGDDSLRESARNCFYAIIVDGEDVVEFGDVCAEDFHPEGAVVERADGKAEIYPIDNDGNERKWRFARNTVPKIKSELKCDIVNGEKTIRRRKAEYRFKTVWTDKRYNANSHGSRILGDVMGPNEFSFPKSLYTVMDCLNAGTNGNRESIVLDYFAGSGTTGHAVINLNREDGGSRRFILVEMGAYFYTVLKPRIAKVLYSPDWKDGKAKTHGQGCSALVKHFALESYEDALNNLPATGGDLLAGRNDAEKDALIRYALDLEMGPHLLDLDAFRDPWGYTIDAQLAGDDEIRPQRVDLIETFNYLLGLRVTAYGPLERYSAEFERADHDADLGRLKIKDKLRRDADGPFVFQQIEGTLNDDNETRVLVVWRKLTDDPEQDAAVLDARLERYAEKTTERSEHREYAKIYLNGPITVPQPTAELRTVYPIEETFKARMFEDGE